MKLVPVPALFGLITKLSPFVTVESKVKSVSVSTPKVMSFVEPGVNDIAPSAVIPPIPVASPVVDISQSLLLTATVSPPSPSVTNPLAVKVPETVKVESAVTAVVIFPPLIARSPERAVLAAVNVMALSPNATVVSVPAEASKVQVSYQLFHHFEVQYQCPMQLCSQSQ